MSSLDVSFGGQLMLRGGSQFFFWLKGEKVTYFDFTKWRAVGGDPMDF